MHPDHEKRLRRRRAEKGAVAIETALSLIVVTLVLIAGITFGHAMVVNHRLTAATNRAARVCAMGDPANIGGCVQGQVNQSLGNLQARCAPLAVAPQALDLGGGLQAVEVSVTCTYQGGPWIRFLNRFVREPLRLRAKATMPIR